MKYLQFKGASDAGFFSYYDKEKAENVKFLLKEVAVTKVCYTVKGWDDLSGSAIYSGDIEKWDEELTVRSGGGTLATGVYKDIKEDIIASWAKIHIKIVGVQDWEEISLALKWLNFFQLSETLKNMDIKKNKLAFDKTEDDKKGAVKFKKTVFKKWSEIKKDSFDIKQNEEITVEDVPF